MLEENVTPSNKRGRGRKYQPLLAASRHTATKSAISQHLFISPPTCQLLLFLGRSGCTSPAHLPRAQPVCQLPLLLPDIESLRPLYPPSHTERPGLPVCQNELHLRHSDSFRRCHRE